MTANQKSFLEAWCQAMRYGLLTGRPYSEHCMKLYIYQMSWFFERFDIVSVETLKQALLSIPIHQYAKRLKLFEAMSCFCKYLIQEGIIQEVNLLQRLKAYRPRRHLPPKKLSVDQGDIDKLLNVCETPMDTLLVILLSHTGLRASEAAGLKLDDINLEKRFLIIRLAKWGKTRRVGLTIIVVDTISTYLSQRSEMNSNYLMNKINGKPMDRNGILTRIYKLGKKAKIPVSPHALRRAFVTINANKGRPLPMLQIACGHSNITTTRSYCMTTEDETIEAMKAWD